MESVQVAIRVPIHAATFVEFTQGMLEMCIALGWIVVVVEI